MSQTESRFLGKFLPKNAVVMKRKSAKKTSAAFQAGQAGQTGKKKQTGSQQTDSVKEKEPQNFVMPANMAALITEIQECTACGLCNTRTQTVPGDGNLKARLMIVGEAPGEQEDLQGRPFIGRAGQLLEKMIEAIGFKRSDVYIANVIKCRPPENRNPEPHEVENCEHFLLKQLELIQPEVIVALGKFAAQTLLRTETTIGQLRGNFHSYTRLKSRTIPLMPTWHPAYLLRNPSAKKDSWEDLKQVAAHLKVELPKRNS